MTGIEKNKFHYFLLYLKILKKKLPWEDGLGSCWAVEWVYSDRKSCVGFRPIPKKQKPKPKHFFIVV